MRKTVFSLLAIALVLPCAFAVDGVVLVNLSTVMAAGGFPYIIKDPGSYKLSGNLTMSTSTTGNYAGLDIAIGINSSGVVLDLNGFSIIVNNSNANISHNFFAIAELGTFQQVSIKNGTITVNTPILLDIRSHGYGIFLSSSTYCSVEDLSVLMSSSPFVTSLALGRGSLVRRNRLNFFFGIICPSVIVENVGAQALFGPSCVAENNSQ